MNEPGPDRTLLQFSLRSLFVAMGAVAALSALAAPWLRDFTREQWVRLGILLGVTAILALADVAMVCFRRRRAERKGGKLLLRISMPRRTWLHALNLIAFLVGMTSTFCLPLIWVLKPGLFPGSMYWTLPFVFSTVVAASYVVVNIWWRLDSTPLEARENGLICGGLRFLPWVTIEAHRWGGLCPSYLTLHLTHGVVSVLLSPENKEPLDRLLHEMENPDGRSVPRELAP